MLIPHSFAILGKAAEVMLETPNLIPTSEIASADFVSLAMTFM